MTMTLNIRWAGQADREAIARLASLDSKRAPAGELLIAESGGEVVAALPATGGRPLADPFRRTAEIVDLLELRARQLQEGARSVPSRQWGGRQLSRARS